MRRGHFNTAHAHGDLCPLWKHLPCEGFTRRRSASSGMAHFGSSRSQTMRVINHALVLSSIEAVRTGVQPGRLVLHRRVIPAVVPELVHLLL
jgi:hypothetical protein